MSKYNFEAASLNQHFQSFHNKSSILLPVLAIIRKFQIKGRAELSSQWPGL